MITIQEIPVENIDEFWEIHYKYLIDDGLITDEEDKEYFAGDEYRGVTRQCMQRVINKHHMVYFVRDGIRIGAAQYIIFKSRDRQCFILDFWVFPEFRGNGTGHECFRALEAYTRDDFAEYYEINSTKEDSQRFWKSLGFVEDGVDDEGMPLFVKRD